MSASFDLSSLGSVGQAAAQTVAVSLKKTSYMLYLGRALIHPFRTVGIMVVLVMILMYFQWYITGSFMIGLILAFGFLKFIPNPAWVYTKPLEVGVLIIEKVEDKTGLNASAILDQIANGAGTIVA